MASIHRSKPNSGSLPQTFSTSRLYFRPFSKEDAEAVYSYWKSDPDWEKFNESIPTRFSFEDAERFVLNVIERDWLSAPIWAVQYNTVVVGVVSLSLQDTHARLGYGIHGDLRGQGMVIEAIDAVMGLVAKHLPDVNTIRAYTHTDNRASHRVLEKLGFHRLPDDAGVAYEFHLPP